MENLSANANEKNNDELDKLINSAIEASNVIAFKSILDQNHIPYDDTLKTVEELKEKALKGCSKDIQEKIINQFDSYNNQSLSMFKNFDPNNLSKYKAEQLIKRIGNIASPIAQTLAKSTLTILMYQGLYLLPINLKLGIAGTTFVTKRVPKIIKSTRNAIKEAKKDGHVIRNISKKVVGTIIAGGVGLGAITILNYLSNGTIPDTILNKLPGIKESLRLICSPSKLRKAVLATTGIVKGIDAYNSRNKQETALFQPIIKGFFEIKGIKIDEDLKDFKDIEKYINKLDDQGKYEFKQYLNKCIAMKKMAENPNEKIKKAGKKVIKLVCDAFETASYLSILQPLIMQFKPDNDNPNPDPQPQPEPVTVKEEDPSKIPVTKPQPVLAPTTNPEPSPVPSPALPCETLPRGKPEISKITEPYQIETEEIEPEIEMSSEIAEEITGNFRNSSQSGWQKFLDDCAKNAEAILQIGGATAVIDLILQLGSTLGPAVIAL